MSKMVCRVPKNAFRRRNTFDNRTGEIQQSKELLIGLETPESLGLGFHQDMGPAALSVIILCYTARKYVNYVSCPHEGDRDRITDMRQECIQSASELGKMEAQSPETVEKSKKHQ